MKKKAFKLMITVVSVIAFLCVFLFILIWNGVIQLNGFSADQYPVKGVDVSSYQGEIDWKTLSSQDVSFVFMKATEGSSYVDACFDYNYEAAKKTNLAVGAYHFFSYDSDGKTQAENFINTVASFDGMLPPVIDLEFYGDKEKNPPEREYVDTQLKAMLEALEDHYKLKPIIYATEKSYELYLAGDYEEYDIWIRNVITKPELSDHRDWTFWQYTNRERLRGYSGEEKYIDVNVFHGSTEDFDAYLKSNTYQQN
ncbi:MAG: glycoside hydrolase family 25 protein [Ruminococcus sp.]|nr:glycoside hydrolase family 25 protein [Ruminococcus sp.]